ERLIQEEMKKGPTNPISTGPAPSSASNDQVQAPQQQLAAPGVGVATPKSVEARLNMGLVALPSIVQVGQTVTVTLTVESRNLLNGAQAVLNFDGTKLQFKGAKDGGLFGEGSQVSASVNGNSVTVNVKPGKPVPARANGSLVVLEFVTLAPGSAKIDFDANGSRMTVSS